jgi:drug/metabolite transporter (DMT)-like permease
VLGLCTAHSKKILNWRPNSGLHSLRGESTSVVSSCHLRCAFGRKTRCLNAGVMDSRAGRAIEAPNLKNRISIALIVVSNSVGNVLLGIGMKQMPQFETTSILNYLGSLMTNRCVVMGTALLIIWMIAQLSMFTWADLSYVLPVTAGIYIVTAIVSKFFLDEQVSSRRWVGIVVISCAVLLVAETSPRTQKRPGRGSR